MGKRVVVVVLLLMMCIIVAIVTKILAAYEFGMTLPFAYRWLQEESGGKDFRKVKTILIVPGGGPGAKEHSGFPPWTKNVCDRALNAFAASVEQDTIIFLALSAGSMNAPSAQNQNGHAMMESTLITQYLALHGVPESSIVTDFTSWDTLANAWVARQIVESVIDIRGKHALLDTRIFISDFHAKRMEAVFHWVFGLQPSLLSKTVLLNVEGVDSSGLKEFDRDTEGWKLRQKHEQKAVAQVVENSKKVRSMAQLTAFLFLGGHRGYFSYTHGLQGQQKSKGVGWGG